MAIVFYYTYTPGLLEQLQVKRLPGLFIALIVSFLRVWFSAAKFRHLTEKELTWAAAFRIVLVWDFTSAVSPSTVGGAPMGLYAMSKEKINLGKATAITLYGVLLDQIWFAIAIPFLVLAGFFYDVIPDNAGWAGETVMMIIYLLLLAYAGLLAYSVLRNPALLKTAVNKLFKLPILNRFKDKVAKDAEELERSSYELREKKKGFVLYAFFLSCMSWIARIALPVIVILSFGPSDVILSFLRSFALNLAGLFIPTPGGSGGFEGLFAMFLGTIMPRAGFLALAIFMWRLISYYISIGLGAWAAMWYIKKKVDEVKP
ncbi:flippase-like domain-containing protein [bacterium]|nr:MAG: flippase-like domain-containing protein [bacterium]